MGVITGYSRRTAVIGSGGGGGAINTIYSASDTITDNARSVTLKSGGTASQYLQFLNSGGGNLLKLSGNNSIDFGVSGTGILERHYCKANNSIQTFYANGAQMIDIDGSNGAHQYFSTSGSLVMYFRPFVNYAYMSLSGSQTKFEIYSGGTAYYQVYADSNSVTNYLVNNSNIIKGTINTNGLASFGAASSGSYQLEVYGSTLHKGPGSTSATTTALFQNSASVSALKVKDDLYCIFRAKNAVIPDGDLSNNELSFYIEEATNDLHFKVKYSTGTVKIGKVSLI